MPEGEALLNHAQILQELQRLHREKKTGKAMVATSDNQLLQLVFNNGDIVSATVGLKHGQEAIKVFLAGSKTGRLRFSESKTATASDGSLPSTAAVLQMFGLPRVKVSADKNLLSNPAVHAIIRDELVEFLGPIAELVWYEHLSKLVDLHHPDALKQLIESLAQEVGGRDIAKAKRFISAVEKKLAPK